MKNTTPIVHIQNQALQAMLISCIETFPNSYIPEEEGVRKPSRKDNKHDGESMGLLFGQKLLRENDYLVYNVTLAVTMQSTERTHSSVSWSDVRFERIKQITQTFPELEFLGCFHSHPWAKEDFGNNATEPSDADVHSACMSALDHGTDVIEVILGLTALKNMSYRDARQNDHSINSYCGKFKYRLSAYVTSGIYDEDDDDTLDLDDETSGEFDDEEIDYSVLDDLDISLKPVHKLICPWAAHGGSIYI